MKRKLSEILLEIAKTGLSDEKYFGSELMHALVFLAHVAWNRDTKDADYLKGNQLIENLKSFPQKKRKIQKQLISENCNIWVGPDLFIVIIEVKVANWQNSGRNHKTWLDLLFFNSQRQKKLILIDP